MCNRYRPTSVVRIKDQFGVTIIKDREPELEAGRAPGGEEREPYAASGIGPWQVGPFIHAGGVAVGQWGLIPWFATSRRPTGKGGKPISTNNCRVESVATASSFKGPWSRGQRCLIPALDYDEPYWGTGKNIWWRFARADLTHWALAGIWSEWTDPETGEVVPSYTMLTQNCDAHPLLNRFHKPDPTLPPEAQDKRAVVPIEREHWHTWLHGSIDEALALIRLPPEDLFSHGPADPQVQVQLQARLPGWDG
jgi:putative SOS response-associated peptidase YedK